MDPAKFKKYPKKVPTEAVSGHFAFTLKDLEEHYIKAEYFTLETPEGILEPKVLTEVLSSRSNLLVYDDRVFHISNIEGNIHKYINIFSEGDSDEYEVQQVVLNALTGYYIIKEYECPQDGRIDDLYDQLESLRTIVYELHVDGGEVNE